MKYLLIAAMLAAGAAHAQTTWKLATGYRAESFHTQNIEEFAREVATATQGALKIEVAANNSLVKLSDIPAAVASGKIEAGEAIMSGMGKDVPLAGADGVPFVVGSYEAVQRMWTVQRPGIEREFARKGLKPLYAVPWPPQGL
ncbi:MAG: C4-dicarboxylate ABC transporter substrate-binding protein, partial [Ramlibacter sp.]